MATLEEPLLNGARRQLPGEEPLLNGGHDDSKNARINTGFSTAGWLSLLTFSWLNPLLDLGYRKPLEIEDVPQLPRQDRAREAYKRFCSERERGRGTEQPSSISMALLRAFWGMIVWTGLLKTVSVVAGFVGPYLIGDFVEYLGGRRRYRLEGWVLVVSFFLGNAVGSAAERYYCLGVHRLGVRIRSCLTATLFAKSLRLSSIARKNRTSGEIINYVALDVQRVVEFMWWVHDIWILPLHVALALVILYLNVGWQAATAALVATITTVMANIPLTRLQQKFQEQLMGAKDARMKTTTECLRNMRILKLQAWETEFLSRIEKLRAQEYKYLARDLYMVAASTFLLWTSPTIVAIATFGTCVWLNVPLNPGKVLSTIAVLRVLREPLRYLADLTSILAQAHVSLRRLFLFCQEPELPTDAVVTRAAKDVENAIEIEHGSFTWHEQSLIPGENDHHHVAPPSTLRDINLSVKKGTHVAVCGPVGSGKSALLACMLGEIPKLEGTVRVEGRTAYVAQTAWIQSGTFKDNICFGRSMDAELYDRVLEACDLKKDIAVLPFGDETVIGERGINLSGGQKQRVQLARALYQEADVYFLDDPFSAVDAHTGSHLIKECMMGMLASKTIVYVTHKMESLPDADHILVLRDGAIVQAGKFNELLQKGTDFSTLMGAHNEALENMQLTRNHAKAATSPSPLHQNTDSQSPPEQQVRQLVKEEERERGKVSWRVYWAYITDVAGGAFVPVFLVAQIGFQGFQILNSYWMAWGTSEVGSARVSTYDLILVYVLLAGAGTVCIFVRAIVVSLVGLKTAQNYFLRMLRSIFCAPMSFFDSTPSGRILNRMSADQEQMDLEIPFSMSRVMNALLQLAALFALMSTVTWEVVLLVVPIAVTCTFLQWYYIASGRELARLTSIRKSPIINHYAESIAGAATIRGFHEEDRFMETNLDHLDIYGRAYFYSKCSREWFIIRMEMLSALVFTLFLVLLITFPRASMNPSLAGVAITYSLSLSSALGRFLWNLSNLEVTVVCAERILQYSKLPSEAPLVIKNVHPAHDWPSKGTIVIHNLQVRYNAHSPLVLHGLNCTFYGGERVGIVGRTGSGKSTLILALFRVVEPVGGSIVIDGLDISTIGLHDLRSNLSIIPQDPTLFEGSIRVNLDPLRKYSDSEIWEALDKCQLGDIVRAKDEKLEASVSENGENWSVGQRQLVCLGRALLKQTRILVLDEATASVDSATDQLIQHTLRSEFRHCTVVTVAHRIPTIVDSDRVLVLDNGRVLEHDSPQALLQDSSSFFSKIFLEYSL